MQRDAPDYRGVHAGRAGELVRRPLRIGCVAENDAAFDRSKRERNAANQLAAADSENEVGYGKPNHLRPRELTVKQYYLADPDSECRKNGKVKDQRGFIDRRLANDALIAVIQT